MAEIDNQLLYEILKKIQADVAEVKERIGRIEYRLDKVEERMANLEKRQNASTHFEQAVLAHLASVHDSIDSLRGEMIAMDRRVAALEAIR